VVIHPVEPAGNRIGWASVTVDQSVPGQPVLGLSAGRDWHCGDGRSRKTPHTPPGETRWGVWTIRHRWCSGSGSTVPCSSAFPDPRWNGMWIR